MKRHRNKGLKTYCYYNFILSLAIIVSLSSLGISYAAWNDQIKLNGTLTTGYIEPVFTDAQLKQNRGKGSGTVHISGEGTKLSVQIHDAQHGDVYFLDYQIENKGTVPVLLAEEPIEIIAGEALEVKQMPPKSKAGEIIIGSATLNGRFKLKVRKVPEDCTSIFTVRLPFRQIQAL